MKVILQLNALVGLASATAATAMMALVLTRPTEMAAAVAEREYGTVALAVLSELGGWLHALLRFL